jgi:hypothetical protein
MKAWPRITTLAVRSRLSPRIGRLCCVSRSARRDPSSAGRIRHSDRQCKLFEGRGNGEPGEGINPEFVVASSQILDEGVTSDHDAGGPVPFESPHRSQPGLQAAVISLDGTVALSLPRLRRDGISRPSQTGQECRHEALSTH